MQSTRKTWYQSEQEENSRILQKFWEMRVQPPNRNENSITNIKNMFLVGIPPIGKKRDAWVEELNAAWENPATFEKYENFAKYFAHVSSLKRVGIAEGLFPSTPKEPVAISEISEGQRDDIFQYIKDKELSIVALTGSAVTDKVTSICSSDNRPEDIFSIHSVGKVFTGILAMRMLSEGIISEKDFAVNPIQLDESVYKSLQHAPKVRDRLNEITLHQALTHQAGLGVGKDVPSGDYLNKYGHDIESGNIEPKEKIADFLPYVFNQVTPKNEYHYSNTGMLLGSLSLEYLYNKYRLEHPEKKLEQLDFDGLMQKYVIEPAKLTYFQNTPPDKFKYNQVETNAKSFAGSPAGGSFTTAGDLKMFSTWLYEEYHKQPEYHRVLMSKEEPKIENIKNGDLIALKEDGQLTIFWLENGKVVNRSFGEDQVQMIVSQLPAIDNETTDLKLIQEITLQYGCKLSLRSAMKKYGQEFFHDNTISHAGDAPSGSAYFSLNLQTGNIAIILNDQRSGAASELGYAIEENVFSKPMSSTTLIAKNIGTKKMAKDDIAIQPTKAKKAAQEFVQPIGNKRATSTDDSNITYGKGPRFGK